VKNKQVLCFIQPMLMIAICAFISYAKPQGSVSDPNLVARWTFDEGSGDSAYDESGNGNHFRLYNGVKWVDGVNGKALQFDGIDDKGLCDHQACQVGMASLTIEAVIWLDKYNLGYQWVPILGKWGPGSSEDDAWALDIDRSPPYGGHGVAVGSTSTHVFGKSAMPILRWIHLVYTWDGIKSCIYINGKKTDEATGYPVGAIQNAITELRLGHNTSPDYFKGKMDELALYKIALSADSVACRFASLGIPPQKPCDIHFGMRCHFAHARDEIWAPLYITNYENYSLNSCKFSINFDTAIAQFIGFALDSGLIRTWSATVDSSDKGSIHFTLAGEQQSLTYGGEGELIRCKMKLKDNLPDNSSSALNITNIVIDEQNGLFEATSTPGKISTGALQALYGDLDGNSKVDGNDAKKIVDYIVNTQSATGAQAPDFSSTIADVSGNGTVTSYDAALIYQYCVGLMSEFPVSSNSPSPSGLSKKCISGSDIHLTLVSQTSSSATYEITGNNFSGFAAGQFSLLYDPAILNCSAPAIVPMVQLARQSAKQDIQNNKLNIAITINDRIDSDEDMKLMSITVAKLSNADAGQALRLSDAMANEVLIMHNSESFAPLQKDLALMPNLKALFAGNVLRIFGNSKNTLQVRIFNSSGQCCRERSFDPARSADASISMMQSAGGIYYCVIRSGNHALSRRIVVR